MRFFVWRSVNQFRSALSQPSYAGMNARHCPLGWQHTLQMVYTRRDKLRSPLGRATNTTPLRVQPLHFGTSALRRRQFAVEWRAYAIIIIIHARSLLSLACDNHINMGYTDLSAFTYTSATRRSGHLRKVVMFLPCVCAPTISSMVFDDHTASKQYVE